MVMKAAHGSITNEDWIDISVPLRTGMVHYPGDPPVKLDLDQDLDKGDPVTVTRISMSAHAGTHVDAPRHFLKGTASIDDMPVDATNGAARVITITDEESIKLPELEGHDIVSGEILLFKTRNSSLWSHDTFRRDFVYLSTPAAVYLAEKGVRAVGIDYLSVDGFEKNEGEAHRILLEASVWIIEGLDLSAVEPGRYDLMCLPLRIEGGEAAPARALVRPCSACHDPSC
jgi:arylformamidase